MTTEKDNRHGHRNRLRTRLTKAGRTAFADHELLELLLTYAIPRKDTKQLAKKLIDRFGSFAAVFDQPKERLLQIEGIGTQTSVFLSAIRASNDEPASVLLKRIIESLDRENSIQIQRKSFGLGARNMMNYKKMIA